MEQEIDGWIEQLTQCKQLPENDVKKLCDKVCESAGHLECVLIWQDHVHFRQERF